MTWHPDYTEIALRLLGALAAGGFIGLERSYHGRPAGFRTHGLVCLASSLLMLVSVYEGYWLTADEADGMRMDPTRMAQGIMTGIGFLGAGVIMIQGFSVRGLTTAASIWITAAIGILIGIGFYFPAILAVLLTLGTLSLFRWIETLIPAQFHAYFVLRLAREQAMSEEELRGLAAKHGFSVASLNYRLDAKEGFYEYRMIIRAKGAESAKLLTQTLNAMPAVIEFRISPTGD
jgi:putative Mg2+ transporter-C (MgtC) family protein